MVVVVVGAVFSFIFFLVFLCIFLFLSYVWRQLFSVYLLPLLFLFVSIFSFPSSSGVDFLNEGVLSDKGERGGTFNSLVKFSSAASI